MKTLIICESHHQQNTIKVARRLATVLNAGVVPAMAAESIEEYDLIGFGSGIYFQRHHRALLTLAEKLNLKDKPVFVFSTSGLGWRRYNRHLIKILKSKGATVVGDFTCKGRDTFGLLKLIGGIARRHPNEKDLKKAEAFALGLLKSEL
ncbi:MAG: flavodoxin family protein [Bacilli bacterium]|nr:flavodoxin family protein [Bacilli bacterium]MDD4077683.1 flavodoxin family protein [Bacilli bacterium]